MIIDLNLKGKQVVIAGGGREATKKAEALLSQDCEIFVHAEKFSREIAGWQKAGKVQVKTGLLSGGAFLQSYDRLILVMAATDDKALNRKIVDYAKQLRCYAYAVDDPEVLFSSKRRTEAWARSFPTPITFSSGKPGRSGRLSWPTWSQLSLSAPGATSFSSLRSPESS